MKKYIITFSILMIFLCGCIEDDVINTPKLASTQTCQDHITAESIFNDIGRLVQEGLTDNKKNKACPYYTLINSNNSDSDTLIIDFGNGNPACLYSGKIRTGKIIVSYTGKYHDSLSVINTSFDNYFSNYNLVQGQQTITNQGKNIFGKIWFTIESNASITTNNGTIDWNANIINIWENGQDTYSDFSDDLYKMTGIANGNSVNGNSFSITIIDSLEVDFKCIPSCIVKSGNTRVNPNGYNARIINYGDSLCDCNINIKINGDNYPLVNNN